MKCNLRSLALLSLACSQLASAQGETVSPSANLLFESGFEETALPSATPWFHVWPRQMMKTPPVFERSSEGAHGGRSAAVITVADAGHTYCSYTQVLKSPPAARSVHLEGWIHWTPAAGQPGSASLLLLMGDGSSNAAANVMQEARLPAGAAGWTRVALDAPVPAGATQWVVRCGVSSAGRAMFDDLSLTASDSVVESVTLLRAHGDYTLLAGASPDAWVEFSIPFPFEGQTPLQVSLTTNPPHQVARTEIIPEAENRHVRVHLKPGRPPGLTSIRMEALVLVRDRAPGRAKDAALLPREALPQDVAQYFAPTPGLDPAHSGISEVAKTIPRTSLHAATAGVLDWMGKNIRYDGGKTQGAADCFESKTGVCTGQANLAASLFQAADVPCRVLGCLMGGRLQEHYIVEVWAPEEGWRRVESTMHLFPIPDSTHLILHIAHPKFPRSPWQVPLYLRGAQDCVANFRPGADTCWQGMDSLGSYGLHPEEASALEAAARKAFVAWEKAPATAPVVRLFPARASFAKPSPNLVTLLDQLAPIDAAAAKEEPAR